MIAVAARIAGAELRRALGRSVLSALTLSALMFLTLTLAGLADTLDRGSTGVLRTLDADLVIFNQEARQQLLRSRIPRPMTIGLPFVDGVHSVGTIGLVPTSARMPAGDVRVTLVGFSARTPAEPTRVVEGRLPVDGEPRIAALDVSLKAQGVRLGDTIVLGGDREVEVVGFVEDARFLQQPTVWVPPDVWALVRARVAPEAGYAEQLVGAGVVRVFPGADPGEVAAAIEAELDGVEVVTLEDAITSIPGVDVQRGTFTVLVAVSIAVVSFVVGLLSVLEVTERRRQLAILRAVGAPRRVVRGALIARSMLLWAVALVGGSVATWLLARVAPDAAPLGLRWPVLAVVGGGLLVATVIGTAVALGRVSRIDPATAMQVGQA